MAMQTEAPAWVGRYGRSLQVVAMQFMDPERHALVPALDADPDEMHQDDAVLRQSPIARKIEQSIGRTLPLCAKSASYGDYDSLAADFSTSVQMLREAAADMDRFVHGLWQANFRYVERGKPNSELRQTFLASYYGDMAKATTNCLTRPAAILWPELEGIPVESAEAELRDLLDELIGRFAVQVCQVLARLQHIELIGRMRWATPTACAAFYYEDVVVHAFWQRQVTYGPDEYVQFDHEQRVRRVQDVKTVTRDRHVVRHGIRCKVLGNTREKSIGEYRDTTPANVQQLLNTIPSWLRDQIRLVSGETRSEVPFTQDIYIEEREVTEIKKRELPMPCGCPLATLGDYVLAGWGDRETNIEHARQNYVWLYLLAVVSLLFAGFSAGLAQLGSSVWTYVSTAAALMSLGSFVEARRESALAHWLPASLPARLQDGVAWFVFSAGIVGLMAGLTSAHWLLAGASVAITAIGAFALHNVVAVSGDGTR